MKLNLKEYNSFIQKEAFFINGIKKFENNIDELFTKLNEYYYSKNEIIYRGVNEAKFKIYTSSQRYFLNTRLPEIAISYDKIEFVEEEINQFYTDFITQTINKSTKWNDGLIQKYFSNINIEKKNCLAYLSILQHYGIPTPLIDFTSNPFIALYFAVSNVHNKTENKNEIDDYVSIYCSDLQYVGLDKQNKHLDDKLAKNYNITYTELIDYSSRGIISTKNNLYQIVNNFNIIKQEGLFFYYNHPYKPLEEVHTLEMNMTSNFFGNLTGKKADKELLEEIERTKKIAECINIKKSMIPEIKKRLKQMNILNDTIFPNISSLKNSVLNFND